MPYITVAIIVQLLCGHPALRDPAQGSAAGQGKLTQYTRYLTIARHCCKAPPQDPGPYGQSVPELQPAGSGRCLIVILLMVITLTAGTGLIMWMGELITERGIGNGMST
ncbi:hypothetical protein [Glutamicibacter arilaitensis]|uniref:hypothetical protein n=1 Tax=Glutamicibacter arilaitensis TaxID=256701 RepID=UPI003A912383